MVRLIPAIACLAAVGCTNPLFSDPQTPEDSGTVIIRVRAPDGSPVPGAGVCVELNGEEPYVGRVCGGTRSNGTFEAFYVRTGERRVEVTPPAGYTADAATLARDVQVTRGARIEVVFVLSRIA